MCSLFQIEIRLTVRDDADMTIEISLTGRTALVVGGGGGGIGSSVCHRLADAGADIVALSAVAADLDATQAEVEQRGQQCTSAVVDVHDLETLRSTIENHPEVDLVVNVVGGVTVPHWHRLHDYPIESFDHLLTTNLRYAFTSCQTVAARLIADARPGAMVNISSIASKGQPLLAGYGAAKAGLDSLTRSMAMEWGRHGIRVNNVAPGTVNTPRSGRPVDDPDDPLAKGITLGRRGTPTDIANACVYLLSDLAGYVTGQTLDVDGGPSRGAPAGVCHQPGDPGPLRVLRNRLRRLGTGRGRPRRPRPDRACGPHGVRQCAARPDRRSTSRHEVGTRSDA